MVRRSLSPSVEHLLACAAKALYAASHEFEDDPFPLVARLDRPEWLTVKSLQDYWQCIRYAFGPREQAGLVLFGDFARRLGMIPAVPGLTWSRPNGNDFALAA